MSKTVDMCIMKNYVLVSVAETGQTWSSEDDFVLEKPHLSITVLGNYIRWKNIQDKSVLQKSTLL